jgi:hypothetical protein
MIRSLGTNAKAVNNKRHRLQAKRDSNYEKFRLICKQLDVPCPSDCSWLVPRHPEENIRSPESEPEQQSEAETEEMNPSRLLANDDQNSNHSGNHKLTLMS